MFYFKNNFESLTSIWPKLANFKNLNFFWHFIICEVKWYHFMPKCWFLHDIPGIVSSFFIWYKTVYYLIWPCQRNLILWKKMIYLVKNTRFTIWLARPTLAKILMLWLRKNDSLKKPLKCSSGPEFFKMGQFFNFRFTYVENWATFVVLILL